MLVTVKIELNQNQIDLLTKPTTNQGGWQTLMEELRQCLDLRDPNDLCLILDLQTLEKIIRYYRSYGNGGYQQRLACIMPEISELIDAIFSGLRIGIEVNV